MNNIPAYPHAAYQSSPDTPTTWHDGMTLRDAIFIAVLPALMARSDYYQVTEHNLCKTAWSISNAALETRPQ